MSLTSPTETGQVLVVSSHPIFAKTLVRLVQEAGCQVLASVADLNQALNILQPNTRATVIVDYENIQPRDDEWLPLLQQTDTVRCVMLLSLNRNEMIVHEQRRVTHITENALKQMLGCLNPP